MTQIKNDAIIIKNGKKVIELRNTILDEYLKRFAVRQMDTNYALNSHNTFLKFILIKFDTPISYDTDSEILTDDFDICLMEDPQSKQTINKTNIAIDYTWLLNKNAYIYEYATHEAGEFISDWHNRKITAIGFNTTWAPTGTGVSKPICAIIDTSNYNLYLQDNQLFTVTRRDLINSDALFWSSNSSKVPGALHLAPHGGEVVFPQANIYNSDHTAWASFPNIRTYGIIYSVGFSNYIDRIEHEQVIGADISMRQIDNKLILRNIVSPPPSLARTFLSRFLPFFPTRNSYKYYIIKYKVWQDFASGTYEEPILTPTDTGYYYYMAIPTTDIGTKNIEIKYERS